MLQATGVLGVGVTGTALAAPAVNGAFRNWRAREASKAWDREFRGQANRIISLTDSGLEPCHPDEGPWNGIVVFVDDSEKNSTPPGTNTLYSVRNPKSRCLNSASVSVAMRLKNSWMEASSCRVQELIGTVSTPCVFVCDAFYDTLCVVEIRMLQKGISAVNDRKIDCRRICIRVMNTCTR